MLDGRVGKNNTKLGLLARAEEALCKSALFGSAMTPNCCFILIVMAVETWSDRWRKAFSSVAIVSAS